MLHRFKPTPTAFVLYLFTFLHLGVACAGSGEPGDEGDLGGLCYPNDTCNGTLVCEDGDCVIGESEYGAAGDGDGDGDGDDDGHAVEGGAALGVIDVQDGQVTVGEGSTPCTDIDVILPGSSDGSGATVTRARQCRDAAQMFVEFFNPGPITVCSIQLDAYIKDGANIIDDSRFLGPDTATFYVDGGRRSSCLRPGERAWGVEYLGADPLFADAIEMTSLTSVPAAEAAPLLSAELGAYSIEPGSIWDNLQTTLTNTGEELLKIATMRVFLLDDNAVPVASDTISADDEFLEVGAANEIGGLVWSPLDYEGTPDTIRFVIDVRRP